MKSKLKIKPLAIPGMAFFIIFVITLIIIGITIITLHVQERQQDEIGKPKIPDF